MVYIVIFASLFPMLALMVFSNTETIYQLLSIYLLSVIATCKLVELDK